MIVLCFYCGISSMYNEILFVCSKKIIRSDSTSDRYKAIIGDVLALFWKYSRKQNERVISLTGRTNLV